VKVLIEIVTAQFLKHDLSFLNILAKIITKPVIVGPDRVPENWKFLLIVD
jgi:hypothetical protein